MQHNTLVFFLITILTILVVVQGVAISMPESNSLNKAGNPKTSILKENIGLTKILFYQEFDGLRLDADEMEFKSGDKITLIAEPNEGYFFNYWEIDGQKVSEKNEFQYTMPNKDITVIGHFKKIVQPSVRITSPTVNSVLEENKTIQVKFEAYSENGRITKVELFRNGNLIGSVNDPESNFSLTNLPIGNHSLTVKAFDDKGAVAISPEVAIAVVPTNLSPIVQIVSPSNGSEFFEGEDVRIEAEALDSDGKITKVEFYRGNVLIGTRNSSPYVAVIPKIVSGSYSITAKAFDDSGASTISSSVTINVKKDVDLPDIMLVTPVDNQYYYEGSTVTFTVMFSGNDQSVDRVEYYIGNERIGISESSPYSFEWKNAPVGDYIIKAVAFGGIPEKKKESISVKISVKKIIFEIVSPFRNSRIPVSSDLEIKVNVPKTDKKVKRVEFYRGNQLLGSSTTAPYSFIWKKVPLGEQNLVARLVYDDNTVVLSSIVKIFVINPPKVELNYTISENLDQEEIQVIFGVTISDLEALIIEVQYFVEGNLIGSNAADPFGFNWEAQPGKYKVTAIAKDNKGNKITSEEVTIDVKDYLDRQGLPFIFNYVIGPNPTVDYLNIFFSELEEEEEFRISVVSMNGNLSEVYLAKTTNSTITIDVADLRKGIYAIHFEHSGKYVSSTKFIKL
jgi:hypothetical protein